MFLVFYHSGVFDITNVENDEYKTLQDAIYDIGEVTEWVLWLSKDHYVYDVNDIIDDYGEDKRFFNENNQFDWNLFEEQIDPKEIITDSIGDIEIYNDFVLTIRGEIE